MVRSEKDEVGVLSEADKQESGGTTGFVPTLADEPGGRLDPEVREKTTRRRFTASYKLRIVREADACTRPGAIGALLRREGLYSSLLNTWRGQRDRSELAGLAPKKRGRVPAAVNPLTKRVAELERDKRTLERRIARQELMLEVQKKVSELLGIPLAKLDDDGSDS
jgi:transposase-like protein